MYISFPQHRSNDVKVVPADSAKQQKILDLPAVHKSSLLSIVLRPHIVVAQANHRLNAARVNETTNSYPRLNNKTGPSAPVLSAEKGFQAISSLIQYFG